jgi:hypothetical protein
MVSDLMEVVGPDALDSLLFGGAAAPEQLPSKAMSAFPTAVRYLTTSCIRDLQQAYMRIAAKDME